MTKNDILFLMLAIGLLLTDSSVQSKDSEYEYTAVVGTKIKVEGLVRAGSLTWVCSSKSCTTKARWEKPVISECSALAAKIGEIVSFGRKGLLLDKNGLAECNKGGYKFRDLPGPEPPGYLSESLRTDLLDRIQERKGFFDAFKKEATGVKEVIEQRDRVIRWRYGLTRYHGDDCDDTRGDVYKDAPEVCDHVDNNCNSEIDEHLLETRYLDADGDGHGDPARRMEVCADDVSRYATRAKASGSDGGWLVEIGNDCDDTDPKRWREC